jgi:phosphohistidine phosphatase
MKNLFLLRHAKSSWDDPGVEDFDRPLNERGRKAAPLMGEVIRKKKVEPDLILCSPAKRARQTARLVLEAAKLDVPVSFENAIYEASSEELIEVLSAQNSARSILLIGHNPGLEDLVGELTGRLERFPTAALASIELGIGTWQGITRGAGQLCWIIRPKEIRKL